MGIGKRRNWMAGVVWKAFKSLCEMFVLLAAQLGGLDHVSECLQVEAFQTFRCGRFQRGTRASTGASLAVQSRSTFRTVVERLQKNHTTLCRAGASYDGFAGTWWTKRGGRAGPIVTACSSQSVRNATNTNVCPPHDVHECNGVQPSSRTIAFWTR